MEDDKDGVCVAMEKKFYVSGYGIAKRVKGQQPLRQKYIDRKCCHAIRVFKKTHVFNVDLIYRIPKIMVLNLSGVKSTVLKSSLL